MKGLCETCKLDNMCARGEVKMSAFKIEFSKDKKTVTRCDYYQRAELPDEVYP